MAENGRSGGGPGYAKVALPLPVRQEFDYGIPACLGGRVSAGERVRVPFGRRHLVGYCVGLAEESDIPPARIRYIEELLDPAPVVGPDLLALTRWMADYYACSWGEALAAALPAGVGNPAARRPRTAVLLAAGEAAAAKALEEAGERRPEQARVLRVLAAGGEGLSPAELARRARTTTSPIRTLARAGMLVLEELDADDDPFAGVPAAPDTPPELTADQARALASLAGAIERREFRVELLWGVTGSGKTEVYLRAIEPVVRRGQQAIVLVPEIALTPQTVRRFRARFERVAVLHSGLTESSRRNQWQRIARREADVVVGPRSAVFAPVSDLGLVVLDEEHEPSFKQNSTPRYHARDVAIMRAHFAGAAVVLGSATPSLESFANAKRGKFHMERLPSRVRERPLPPVEVVDMGQEFGNGNGTPLFSRTLVLHLGNALAAGEQAILFLNRRGHSSFLSCLRCGHVVGCPRCEVTLTWHAAFRRALCHYCGHEEPVGAACPACREGRLAYRGAGTERVESVVGKLFPDARLARMDSDTMGSRGAYEKVLGDFEARRIDILVGTQMIGKGLDFPGVTVVGVLSADTVLHFPDFRSAERTFQLVTQVAGRAGRGNRPGRVVVQTFSASHYAIECAARHDYASFCERDLAYRRELGYPPFGRLARVLCLGPDEAKVRERAREAALRLSGAHAKRSVAVLGPAPCPIARIDGKFRWHTLVKAPRPTDLAAALSALGDLSSSAGPVQVVVDVDPVEMV